MKEEPTYSPFGPRAHERDLKLTPEKVQLADGTPPVSCVPRES